MENILLIFIIILIPVFISLMFIPYWTRRTESFGVSIPEEVYYSEEIRNMRKQYLLITGIVSLVIIALFGLIGARFSMNENVISLLFSVLIGIYIVGTFLVYLIFHRKMKQLKQKENWNKEKSQLVVIDTHFRNEKLTYSNIWFIISFMIALLTAFLSLRFYDQIPERIPMQYNFSGAVTNWADKSYRTILILPIMQVYMTLLFLFINTMIAKAKQQVSAVNPDKSRKQNIIFRRRWSAFNIITGTALTLMFSLIQLAYFYPMNQQIPLITSLVITAGIIIGVIVLSITTGQGGSRVKTTSGEGGEVIDRDDDKYWKLGQFYFNKNDPALFLEKRFGIGWTINCAHPIAWIILLAIILGAILIPLLLSI